MLATRRKRKSVARLTKNARIIKAIIHAIQEKKGENIISLDLRKIPEAVADFFVDYTIYGESGKIVAAISIHPGRIDFYVCPLPGFVEPFPGRFGVGGLPLAF